MARWLLLDCLLKVGCWEALSGDASAVGNNRANLKFSVEGLFYSVN